MRILILMWALLFPPLLSAAQEGSDGLPERIARAVFTATERTLIEEYFGTTAAEETEAQGAENDDDRKANKGKGGKSKKMPPGLAKRDELPPGLERQLERNGTLPPGLAKRDLPPDLARRLPARNDGTETAIVDSDVVLIEAATGVVLDILRGVVGKTD